MNVPSIYEWHCKSNATDCRYIGSTNNLQQRIWLHNFGIRNGIKNPFYDLVRDTGGLDNWQCNKLEQLPTDISKLELRKREQHHIVISATPLINVKRAYLSPEALKQKQKEYYKIYYRENIHNYNKKSLPIVNGGGSTNNTGTSESE